MSLNWDDVLVWPWKSYLYLETHNSITIFYSARRAGAKFFPFPSQKFGVKWHYDMTDRKNFWACIYWLEHDWTMVNDRRSLSKCSFFKFTSDITIWKTVRATAEFFEIFEKKGIFFDPNTPIQMTIFITPYPRGKLLWKKAYGIWDFLGFFWDFFGIFWDFLGFIWDFSRQVYGIFFK